MKIVKTRKGTEKMYKPNEAAPLLGYHPRTVRRFIQSGLIRAVDSNKKGKQPVWWIAQSEIDRLQKSFTSYTEKPAKKPTKRQVDYFKRAKKTPKK